MLGELGEMALAEDPELLTLPWGGLLTVFCGVLRGAVPLMLLAGAWAVLAEGMLEGWTFFWVVTAGCGLGGVGQGIKAPVLAFMTGGHCGSASSLACSLSMLVQALKPSTEVIVRAKASCFVIVNLFYERLVTTSLIQSTSSERDGSITRVNFLASDWDKIPACIR